MHGLRGNGAREKTALMPDPLRRSSFGFVVAFDLWDHLGRRVTPILAVYATTTVVVTVTAGTQCAWYGLTGPLDAEQSPPGPGT